MDSNATLGSDAAGYGQNPDRPFATFVYALATVVAAGTTDDTIMVMPGHTETIGITGAAAMTLSVAGLKVIGLGGPTRKPAFLIDGFSNTYVSITGADTLIDNITWKAGHEDIASAIIVAAKGVTIRNCTFLENVATENFLICISVGAANNDSDHVLIEGNQMYQPDTASTHAIWFVKDQNHCIVRRNLIQGDYVADSAIIGSPGTENFLNLAVTDNLIDNSAGDSAHVIEFAGTNTGICARNLSGDVDADGTPFIFTGGAMCENYHTGADAASGFIYPAIDS